MPTNLEPLLHEAERRAVMAVLRDHPTGVGRSGSTSATRYWIAPASEERRP